MNQTVTEQSANTGVATVVYVLYLLTLISGITAIVGVIMAYIYKDGAPDWLRAHYEFQIRTFWIGLLYGVIAGALCAILIGFPLLVLLAIWWIIRCVKGLKFLDQRAAYPDHRTWAI